MGIKEILLGAACFASLMIGCDAVLPPQGLDDSVAASHVAAGLAYHKNLCTDDHPDDDDAPEPSGDCDNCYGTGWMGDGRPRDLCPVCNDDGRIRKPSVQEYLRQIDEWRRRNESVGPAAWSPTESEWEKLHLRVGEVESGVVQLQAKFSAADTSEVCESCKCGCEDPESCDCKCDCEDCKCPNCKCNEVAAPEEVAEDKPPEEKAAPVPEEASEPTKVIVTMHSFEGCTACTNWWNQKAPLLAPDDHGEYRAGVMRNGEVTVPLELRQNKKSTAQKSHPWWTIEYGDKKTVVENYTEVTPLLIWSFVNEHL